MKMKRCHNVRKRLLLMEENEKLKSKLKSLKEKILKLELENSELAKSKHKLKEWDEARRVRFHLWKDTILEKDGDTPLLRTMTEFLISQFPPGVLAELEEFLESFSTSSSSTDEFHEKDKLDPDQFIDDFDDDPNTPARPYSAMAKCKRHGGKCDNCGTFTFDLCVTCGKCEVDCDCPKKKASICPYPNPVELYSQVFGGDAWLKTSKVSSGLTEKEEINIVGGLNLPRKTSIMYTLRRNKEDPHLLLLPSPVTNDSQMVYPPVWGYLSLYPMLIMPTMMPLPLDLDELMRSEDRMHSELIAQNQDKVFFEKGKRSIVNGGERGSIKMTSDSALIKHDRNYGFMANVSCLKSTERILNLKLRFLHKRKIRIEGGVIVTVEHQGKDDVDVSKDSPLKQSLIERELLESANISRSLQHGHDHDHPPATSTLQFIEVKPKQTQEGNFAVQHRSTAPTLRKLQREENAFPRSENSEKPSYPSLYTYPIRMNDKINSELEKKDKLIRKLVKELDELRRQLDIEKRGAAVVEEYSRSEIVNLRIKLWTYELGRGD